MDNTIVLERTIALCEQAMKEKNDGNVALLNKIGGNGGLQTFFANAFSIHSVQYNHFHKQFPTQWKEIVGFWEAVEKEELAEAVQVEKTNSIEERLGKLETLLTSFLESQKPAEEVKLVKKGKKQAEPVIEVETNDTTDGTTTESEA